LILLDVLLWQETQFDKCFQIFDVFVGLQVVEIIINIAYVYITFDISFRIGGIIGMTNGLSWNVCSMWICREINKRNDIRWLCLFSK